MNWRLTLNTVILLLVMCMPHSARAQANTNNPYCTHDPACWIPVDDATFGAECCVPVPNETCTPPPLQPPDDSNTDTIISESDEWEEDMYNSYGQWVGIEDWKAVLSGTLRTEAKYRLQSEVPFEPGCESPLHLQITVPGDEGSVTVGITWKVLEVSYTHSFQGESQHPTIFNMPAERCRRYFAKYALKEKQVILRAHGTKSSYKSELLGDDYGWTLQQSLPFDRTDNSGWLIVGYEASHCVARCFMP